MCIRDRVNADSKDELVALINSYKPDAVLNLALPYQDLTIMDACLGMRKDRAVYEKMYELIRPVVKDKTVLEVATGT